MVPAQVRSEKPGASSIAENFDVDRDGVTDATDLCPNSVSGSGVDAWGCAHVTETEAGTDSAALVVFKDLYDATTLLEPMTSFVRHDGVVVIRIGDRDRDRHAKDITSSDHYDHYLAHYWEYLTVRIKLEGHVPNGQCLIKATFIT